MLGAILEEEASTGSVWKGHPEVEKGRRHPRWPDGGGPLEAWGRHREELVLRVLALMPD